MEILEILNSDITKSVLGLVVTTVMFVSVVYTIKKLVDLIPTEKLERLF